MTANFDWSQYDKPSPSAAQASPTPEFNWDQYDAGAVNGSVAKEGLGKAFSRTAVQPALAYLQKYTWPLNLLQLAAEGGSQDVLTQLSENEPELKGDIAELARQKAMEYFPTQQGAEKIIEEKTGLPLTPQTGLQKGVRLAGTAATFRPGGLMPKTVAAATAPAVAKTLESLGVPEYIAETIGLLASGATPSPSAEKIIKPSGMPVRKFEKLEKPTKITETRHQKINQVLESDFRKISDEILSKNETYAELKANPQLKSETSEAFGKVEELAEKIPDIIDTDEIQYALQKRLRQRPQKGYMDSEFERSFNTYSRRLNNKFRGQEASVQEVVQQFRKNNSELGELFEPGKSGAVNRAKKEALLEHNRAIEDVFNTRYPDTEFKNLFEKTNARWSDLMNIDRANEFIDSAIKGKIDYKQAAKLLEDKSLARPFERLVGKDGFENFKTLTKDLLSTEKAMAQLKIAGKSGLSELVTLAGEYGINPKIAGAHVLTKSAKNLYQTLLDKPAIIIKWKSAITDLKNGNFLKAEKEFQELDSMAKE